MSKILLDTEMAEIIRRAVNDHLIDEARNYQHFLEELGLLIANYFGGDLGVVTPPGILDNWSASFQVNDSVPGDGGVYKDYDLDVVWEDGEERERVASDVLAKPQYKQTVYRLVTYEFDTYSFSGISEESSSYFFSREGAESEAERLGLTVVAYCKDPNKDAVIEEVTVV